jgi:hypothetical protein
MHDSEEGCEGAGHLDHFGQGRLKVRWPVKNRVSPLAADLIHQFDRAHHVPSVKLRWFTCSVASSNARHRQALKPPMQDRRDQILTAPTEQPRRLRPRTRDGPRCGE